MSDGRIHGVHVWIGPPDIEPPDRPIPGPLKWDLTHGIATDTPESLFNSGRDPSTEATHGRAFAEDLPTRRSTRVRRRCCRMAIKPEPGRTFCSTWDVTDHEGEPITVGFVARVLLESGTTAVNVDLPGDELAQRAGRDRPSRPIDLGAANPQRTGAARRAPRARRPHELDAAEVAGRPVPVLRLARQGIGRSRRAPGRAAAMASMTTEFDDGRGVAGVAAAGHRRRLDARSTSPVTASSSRRAPSPACCRCACPPMTELAAAGLAAPKPAKLTQDRGHARTRRYSTSRQAHPGPPAAAARAGPSPHRPSSTGDVDADNDVEVLHAAQRDDGVHGRGDRRRLRTRRLGTRRQPTRSGQRGQIGRGLSAVTGDDRRTDVPRPPTAIASMSRHHRHRHQGRRTALTRPGLAGRHRLCRDGEARQQRRVALTLATTKSPSRRSCRTGALGSDATGRLRRRALVTPGRQPRRLPGRVNAAHLHRHRGEPGQAQHQHHHQRRDRESRLDRDPAGTRLRRWCSTPW